MQRRVANFKLGAFGEFKIFELKSGRDSTPDQAVRRPCGENRAKPCAGRNHDLWPLARIEIHSKPRNVARPVRKEPHDFKRTAFVEVKDLIGPQPVQVGRGFPGRDEEVDRC